MIAQISQTLVASNFGSRAQKMKPRMVVMKATKQSSDSKSNTTSNSDSLGCPDSPTGVCDVETNFVMKKGKNTNKGEDAALGCPDSDTGTCST
ncbi:hypothetical protein CYMTET_44263 [Cymbomonas tetramitiformis]|uniref:Uncharacterized protein n=1 Tax=Cymbomonas tetramitiformis TaxID=36881 RepID=A0AAE0C1T6_9CHLO|nr:hypothetical protein CYMTET_44263 [Cymbomonas tetramitiformis]